MNIQPTLFLEETTAQWSREVMAIGGRIFSAYVFDANRIITEGVTEPSFEMTRLYISSTRGKTNDYLQGLLATDGAPAGERVMMACAVIDEAPDTHLFAAQAIAVDSADLYATAMIQTIETLTAEKPLRVPDDLGKKQAVQQNQFELFHPPMRPRKTSEAA